MNVPFLRASGRGGRDQAQPIERVRVIHLDCRSRYNSTSPKGSSRKPSKQRSSSICWRTPASRNLQNLAVPPNRSLAGFLLTGPCGRGTMQRLFGAVFPRRDRLTSDAACHRGRQVSASPESFGERPSSRLLTSTGCTHACEPLPFESEHRALSKRVPPQ
jgi:hypothetical protein